MKLVGSIFILCPEVVKPTKKGRGLSHMQFKQKKRSFSTMFSQSAMMLYRGLLITAIQHNNL